MTNAENIETQARYNPAANSEAKRRGKLRFSLGGGVTIAALTAVTAVGIMFMIDPPPPSQIILISRETPLAISTRQPNFPATPTTPPLPAPTVTLLTVHTEKLPIPSATIDIKKCPPEALDRRFNPPLPYPKMIDRCR